MKMCWRRFIGSNLRSGVRSYSFPSSLGGEGTFALPRKEKNLIAGYIVYESIQFSDAGAAENLNTSLTKQPTISSPTIQFSF